MSAIATPVRRDVRQGWVRALCVAGGAAHAAAVWAVEVPLLGVRLSIRFGAMRPETVVAGQIVGAALVAGLLGWLLLTALERRAPRSAAVRGGAVRAGAVWAGVALLALVVSLALPLAAATTTSAAVGLIALHLAVGSVVIPGLAYTARRPA